MGGASERPVVVMSWIGGCGGLAVSVRRVEGGTSAFVVVLERANDGAGVERVVGCATGDAV